MTFRLFATATLLLWTATAFAQQPRPIPFAVLDARGGFTMLKQSPDTAASLGVTASQLASRGLGLIGGVHIYPLRRLGFAIGIGGEAMVAHASSQPKDSSGAPIGPAVNRRFRSVSGQLSFNFGRREGWSYLSGGMGPVAFDTYFAGSTPDGLTPTTLNYGGGARWFNTDHLAICFDFRIYATKPATATLNVGTRKRQNVTVISVGVSIR